MWMGGSVRLATSLDGPFTKIENFSYPGGNPAPILLNGSYYLTNQGTSEIFTTDSLAPGSTWTKFSDIDHSSFPPNAKKYHVEDPCVTCRIKPAAHHSPSSCAPGRVTS